MTIKDQFQTIKPARRLWKRGEIKSFFAIAIIIIVSGLFLQTPLVAQAGGGNSPKLKLKITVTNLDTGQVIGQRATINNNTPIQVSVKTNGINCAGAFVLSARGDTSTGAPPVVIYQSVPIIIGPAIGDNTATGETHIATDWEGGFQNYKVSAVCNGFRTKQFDSDFFEFFVRQ